MKLIDNWFDKNFVCNRCGETKSVKYESNDGKTYCNACIMFAEIDYTEKRKEEFNFTIGKIIESKINKSNHNY